MRVLKKLLAVTLSLAMALGVMTVAAPQAKAAVTEVADYTALSAILSSGGEAKLTADITGLAGSNPITVAEGVEVTIDLNGHKLVRSSGGTILNNFGTLTIKDTSEAADGYIGFSTAKNSSSAAAFITNNAGATLNLVSGGFSTMKSTSSSAQVIKNAGTFNMTGGFIKNIVTTNRRVLQNHTETAVMNLSGGVISGNTVGTGADVFMYDGTLNISGNFKLNGVLKAASGKTPNITGGYFKDKVTPASGYSCVANGTSTTYPYKVISSTVNVKYFDGDDEYENLSTTSTIGATYTVAAAQAKEGYSFISWNTKADGTGESYNAGAALTVADAVTLYAQWVEASAAQIKVRFYDGAVLKSEESYLEGQVFALADALTKENCAFDGWNTKEDGTGESYDAGESITAGAADIYLYAQWKAAAATNTTAGVTAYYSTLKKAAASAVDGSVIKLLADASYDSTRVDFRTGTSDKITRAVTFDLGGKTFTSNSEDSALLTASGTTLTVTNGTINAGENPIFFANSGSTVIVLDGSYIGGAIKDGSGGGTVIIKGGTWNADPADYVDTEVYEITDNGDGTYTVNVIPKVEVTADGVTTGYASLTEAWAAAVEVTGTAEVKLLENFELTAALSDFTNEIILDLNGHTITQTAKAQFVKQIYGKFTIQDTSEGAAGKIIASGTTYSSTSYCFINAAYSASKGSGTITLKSGSVVDSTTGGYPIALIGCSAGSATGVTVSGGSILAKADHTALQTANGKITIKGGTINGSLAVKSAGTGSYSITGGTFNEEPDSNYIAQYYELTDNGNGTWTVAVQAGLSVVAKIGTEEYYFLQDAYDAAADGAEIVLTGSSLTDTLVAAENKTVTLNLDGKSVNTLDGARFIKQTAGTINLTNGTVNFIGKNADTGRTNGSGRIYIENAAMNITGVTLNGLGKGNATAIGTATGGAIYLYASDCTMTDSVIQNCTVYNSASGVGYSGAVHLVRKDAQQGSTFYMYNSQIINCSAITQGGAVSVGSSCTFTLDAASTISGCSAMFGGAVFIDVADLNKGDYASGTFNYLGTITDSESTGEGYTEGYPVYSNGFVIGADSVLDTYQVRSSGIIESAAAAVGDTLNIIFRGKFAGVDGATPYLQLVIGGETAKFDGVISGTDCTFTTSIPLAMLANEFTIQLFDSNDTPATNPVTYSGLTYLNDIYTQSAEEEGSETLIAFCASLAKYAQALCNYDLANVIGAKCEAFELPSWASAAALDETPDASISGGIKKATNGTKISSAAVQISDLLSLVFRLGIDEADAAKTISVKLRSGEGTYTGKTTTALSETTYELSELVEISKNSYALLVNDLGPADYDDWFEVSIIVDGQLAHGWAYSVNSYAFNKLGAADAKLVALVKAMYSYNVAAVAYVG